MQKKILGGLAAIALSLSLPVAANAAGFVNGDFETGTFANWETGGGAWYGGAYPTASSYYPGSGPISITNTGFDPRTDNKLKTVYSGDHSARVNDPNSNYSVATIRQRVDGYSDNLIAFAYAAVLQDSHGTTDSDAFIISLDDITTGLNLLTVNVNSASTPSSFTRSSQGWYYTDWTTISFDLAAAGLVGHDFMLSLLANDCPYGAHAGYAYLDGFGGVIPPVGGAVPEPATWAMMIIGFAGVGGAIRSQRRKTSTLATA